MKMQWKLLGILTFFLLLMSPFILKFGRYLHFATTPFSETASNQAQKEDVYILVDQGQSPRLLAKKLEKENIVSSQEKFLNLGKYLRRWDDIKAGEYAVSAKMTPLEILSKFESGESSPRPVTIPEGKNLFQIANILQKKKLVSTRKFIELCQKTQFIQKLPFQSPVPSTLEGYLYPETYYFNRTQSTRQIIQKMVNRFHKVWKKSFQRQAQKVGLSRHETVTLASIIEKETGEKGERPLVSSVFHNRLDRGMRLQSDPTTIYGIWEEFDGNLQRKDLRKKTPYNTYVIHGLPKGPIANPGSHSLKAALNPAESEYLYFVSNNDGSHVFSKTLEQHQKAVRKYQLNKKVESE